MDYYKKYKKYQNKYMASAGANNHIIVKEDLEHFFKKFDIRGIDVNNTLSLDDNIISLLCMGDNYIENELLDEYGYNIGMMKQSDKDEQLGHYKPYQPEPKSTVRDVYREGINKKNCEIVYQIQSTMARRYGDAIYGDGNLYNRLLYLPKSSVGNKSSWLLKDEVYTNPRLPGLTILRSNATTFLGFIFNYEDDYIDLDIYIINQLDKKTAKISSFFYGTPAPEPFIQKLRSRSTREGSHWTSYLLLEIIDWLIINEGCQYIELDDASKFYKKTCRPYTILYLLSKHQPGMYESVGFLNKNPLYTDTIQELLETPYVDFKDENIPNHDLISDDFIRDEPNGDMGYMEDDGGKGVDDGDKDNVDYIGNVQVENKEDGRIFNSIGHEVTHETINEVIDLVHQVNPDVTSDDIRDCFQANDYDIVHTVSEYL